MPPPLATWFGVLCILASGLIVLFGTFTVFHRQERCVQEVMAAQGAGLSTWEAVARCQR